MLLLLLFDAKLYMDNITSWSDYDFGLDVTNALFGLNHTWIIFLLEI